MIRAMLASAKFSRILFVNSALRVVSDFDLFNTDRNPFFHEYLREIKLFAKPFMSVDQKK